MIVTSPEELKECCSNQTVATNSKAQSNSLGVQSVKGTACSVELVQYKDKLYAGMLAYSKPNSTGCDPLQTTCFSCVFQHINCTLTMW